MRGESVGRGGRGGCLEGGAPGCGEAAAKVVAGGGTRGGGRHTDPASASPGAWGAEGTRYQPHRGDAGGPASAPRGETRISPAGVGLAPPFIRNKILVYFASLSDAGLDPLLSFSSH